MKRTFTSILVLALLCFSAINVLAQNTTVKGKVIDGADKSPLPGVSVSLSGGGNATQTDVNGDYSISVPANATLVFTYIGYTTQQLAASGTTLNVSLVQASRNLEQVVVVGYGTQRRKDLTGSISSVNGDELAKQPSINPIAALQGKVPGLTISTSGAAGSSPTVRLRGINTTSGSADPIYVVDGLIQTNIDFLNPGDIESIDVLRDASSVAIYGLRGGNGVIAVTTKKGVRGRTSVSFQTLTGIQHVTNTIDVTDAAGFKRLYSTQLANQGGAPFDYTNYTADTDWQKLILRDALISTNSLTVTNAGEKSTTVLSLGYNKQEGVVKYNDYQKYNIRLNEELKITKDIKIGANLNGFHFVNNPTAVSLNNALWAAPIVGVQNGNQYYAMPSFQRAQVGNPIATLDRFNRTTIDQGYRVNGSLYAEVKFLKNFTWRSSFYTNLNFSSTRGYTPLPFTAINLGEGTTPTSTFLDPTVRTAVNQSSGELREYQQDHTLTYEKEFTGGHRLTALAGFTTLYSYGSSLSGSRTDFNLNVPNNPDFWYLDVVSQTGTGNIVTNGGNGSIETTAGAFGRVNYAYQNKYLVNATIRRDGNSKISPANRWETFGSIGLGWVLSEESFFKTALPGINYFKLRGAFGRLGNASIQNYAYQPTTTNGNNAVFGDNVYSAVTTAYTPDPNLRFEIIQGIDAGFDVRALDNRFNAEVSYYSKTTDGLLTSVTLPNGVPPLLTNLGKINNKGIELSAGWNDKIGKDFKYGISGNFSYVKNKVTSIGPDFNFQLSPNNFINVTQTGQSVGYFYGYQQTGIYQTPADISRTPAFADSQPGDISYADINGDGVISAADRTYLGTPFPPYSYGLNLNFAYKGFDIAAQGQGVAGNKIYLQRRTAAFAPLNYEANRLNAWTGPGTTNVEPIINNARGNNYLFSSYFLEPGDYFRVRNLQVGYTFSPNLLKKVSIQTLRVFFSGQNIKTWSKTTGYTPEAQLGNVLASGADNGIYPVPAVYSLGLNVSF